jgi:TPR repeat protein
VSSASPRAAYPAADFNRGLRCTDDAEAFRNWMAAAEGGCIRAQFLVGLAFHLGRGVPVDFARAAAWYRKAAGSAEEHAIANLGVMGALGQDASADETDAYTWLQSAVGLGHEWLRPVLAVLEGRITKTGEPVDAERVLRTITPEIPDMTPCTQPGCDPSRCDVC